VSECSRGVAARARTHRALADDEEDEAELAAQLMEAEAEAVAASTAHDAELARPMYKKRVEEILTEFWSSQDMDEAVKLFRDMEFPSLRPEISKRLLLLSLDRSDTDREMASRLLSALYGDVLTMLHIAKGFAMLFVLGPDLETDSPGAVGTLAKFLARAVVDEVLPPSFLMDPDVASAGGPIVEEAKALLSVRHAAARMEHVWGATAAAPVSELKDQVRMMVLELFDTSNVKEFERCVRDLHSPAFHHEVVKRLVVSAVARGDAERALASRALKHLGSAGLGLVSETQAEHGFRRVMAELSDLSLDVPDAPQVVEALLEQAREDGALNAAADVTPAAQPPAAAAASSLAE
jgi:hypothetical protein